MDYEKQVHELNRKVDNKELELSQVMQQEEHTKKEKTLMQDTLTKDQYSFDLITKENEQLRLAKKDLEEEETKYI